MNIEKKSYPLPLADFAQLVDSLGEATFLNELLTFLNSYLQVETLQIHCIQRTAKANNVNDVEYFGAASAGICSLESIDEGGRDLLLRYPLYSRECPDIVRLNNLTSDCDIWISRPSDIESPTLREFYFEDGYFKQFCVYAGVRQQRTYVMWLGRLRHDAEFNKTELGLIKQLSKLFLPLIVKHSELITADLSLKQRPGDLVARLTKQLEDKNIKLSSREFEICIGILQGQQAPELAQQLNVARTTITTYKNRAFEKIGVKTRQQLFNWCLHRPIVF